VVNEMFPFFPPHPPVSDFSKRQWQGNNLGNIFIAAAVLAARSPFLASWDAFSLFSVQFLVARCAAPFDGYQCYSVLDPVTP